MSSPLNRTTFPDPDLQPRTGDDDAFGIRVYLTALWQSRWLVIALALALGMAGAAWSVLTPRRYETSVTVSVSASRLSEQVQRVDPLSFVPVVGSQTVADAVVHALKLSEAPWNLTASRLMRRVVTVRMVPDSNLIRVVARFDDPAMATRIANRFAETGIELARQVSRSEVTSVEQEMQAMLAQAGERRHQAEQAYDEFRKVAQLELVRKEVETLLVQRTEFMKTVVELETERAKLARAEQELSSRNRVNVVHESIDRNPAMLEAARGEKYDPAALLSLKLQSEVVNPVFSNLDLTVADVRTRVATLERQREQLLRATGGSAAQIERLAEMYRRESRLEQLDAERKIARATYEDVASRYQGARLAAIARTPQLQIVAPALVPDVPESRFLARNVLLGAVVGTLLGCLLVLGRKAVTG